MDFRKISNLAVDCVIFGLDSDHLNILLQKRTLNLHNDNYQIIDDWVLPGDKVLKSKNLKQSAERILGMITDAKFPTISQFKTYESQVRIYGDRDLLWIRSQGAALKAVTVVHCLTLPKEVIELEADSEYKWFPFESLPELGFDHKAIINDAYEDLKVKITNEPVMFELLPLKFTLNELQTACEILLNIELDNRNFRKKAISKPYIVPLEDKRKVAGVKKPSKLFMFSKDVYEKLAEKDYIISTIL